MLRALAIAAGGAAGALLRYWVAGGVNRLAGYGFPWGTLAVNVLGSFLMGVLYVVLVERSVLAQEYRALVLIGLLGGFTTFSSFSMETLALIESGQGWRAGANAVLSVVLCLSLCWVGLVLGRRL